MCNITLTLNLKFKNKKENTNKKRKEKKSIVFNSDRYGLTCLFLIRSLI